jgi:hypothetical protein
MFVTYEVMMAATEEMRKRLRRMTAEPTRQTYSDDDLDTVIESYPLIDALGNPAFDDDGEVNSDWIATYDLNAAAAEIWTDKAGGRSDKTDHTQGNGRSTTRHNDSQQFQQAMRMARHYGARRSPKCVKVERWEEEDL